MVNEYGRNNNTTLGISNEEQRLILQLRQNVRNILPPWILAKSEDDQKLYFVRWIRARENNLEKSTDMLRNHLQWRMERNADQALNIVLHPFFTQHYPFLVPGVDRKGQPVFCVPLAEWDVRKVLNDANRLAEFDDFITHMFETCIHHMETENSKREIGQPPITQLTMLYDVKNYPYGQLIRYAAIKKMLQIAGVYEAHYPEILSRAIFINCPSYFGMFINLLKPVMAPKTLGKITCHSSMAKWKEEINSVVDPAIIPERYGGTRPDTIY